MLGGGSDSHSLDAISHSEPLKVKVIDGDELFWHWFEHWKHLK
jgi:hypothetical protein